ncbi:MAG: hypothetical protein ACLFWD_06270 [Anaerolineales bacterium]
MVGLLMVMGNRKVTLLAGLLLHYAAVVLLITPSLGSSLALIKLATGAMTVAILWLSLHAEPPLAEEGGEDLIDRPIFRASLLVLVLTAGWGLGRASWLDIPALSHTAEIGATMLLTLGLMIAGFFDEPLRVGLGIITGLSGFEVIYAAVEPSLAVLALLAGVQLGLALIVGFLAQVDQSARESAT